MDGPTDLRLLPAAVGAELGALAGLMLPGRVCVGVVLLALGGALFVRLGHRRRRGVGAVLALLLVLAGSVAGAGFRAETRRSGPVADAARAERPAAVQVVLTGDPKPTRGAVSGDALRRASVTIPARLVRLHGGAVDVRTRAPVLLLASADGWSGLLPSQHVSLSGKLVTPRGPDLAAVVLVRGPPESVGPPSEWQRLAGSLRAGLRKACLRLPADARGLLPGLVVGDTTELPADLADDARSAGLSHLTAVSGVKCY
ncbi:MAG TPA: hypothetical protein VLR26_02495 [Frankiaceae bacterium]|nr:hypothetical protein [Frankiaceae bacterium]